jgi:hypothetical protein
VFMSVGFLVVREDIGLLGWFSIVVDEQIILLCPKRYDFRMNLNDRLDLG